MIVSAFECRNVGMSVEMMRLNGGGLEETTLNNTWFVVSELAAALFLGP
jgi:hypothetical protein